MNLSTAAESWVRILSFLPIVLSSVLGFGIALTKWVQFRRTIQSAEHLMPKVRGLIGAREYPRALSVAQADGSTAAVLVEEALTAPGRSRTRLGARIERLGQELARQLDYGLGGIALIATLGPLFGLLGTVVGIVIVFGRLSAAGGVVSAGELAGGIGTALYTTIAGLIVGICALVSHRWLQALGDDATARLEAVGLELLDLMAGDDA